MSNLKIFAKTVNTVFDSPDLPFHDIRIETYRKKYGKRHLQNADVYVDGVLQEYVCDISENVFKEMYPQYITLWYQPPSLIPYPYGEEFKVELQVRTIKIVELDKRKGWRNIVSRRYAKHELH